MKFEIKSRFTLKVLFGGDFGSIKLCLEAAVAANADLSNADLRGAVLSDADLRGAVLRGADLSDADLRGAVLRDADLSNAVLRNADLRGAVLRDVDLRGADLRNAVLRDAVLRDADLSGYKADLWEILAHVPNEVGGLRQAIVDGRVNGSTYTGECACLVGTIAKVRGCEYTSVEGVTPDASRPAEQWFTMIQKGGTPENNQAARFAVQWIDEWIACWAAAKVQAK